jgi:hypothetical protein
MLWLRNNLGVFTISVLVLHKGAHKDGVKIMAAPGMLSPGAMCIYGANAVIQPHRQL